MHQRPVAPLHTRCIRSGCDLIERAVWPLLVVFLAPALDEVFFGIGDEVTKKIAVARKAAREERMKENRAAGCGVCVGETSSGALLLQRPRSRML
jgi:hypothetical protein